MPRANQKSTVLQILQQQSEPVSLPELLKILGPGYPERSVRRWLTTMVTDGLIEKIGAKRSTRYAAIQQPIPPSSSPTQEGGSIFSEENLAIIERIRQPIFTRCVIPTNVQKPWQIKIIKKARHCEEKAR